MRAGEFSVKNTSAGEDGPLLLDLLGQGVLVAVALFDVDAGLAFEGGDQGLGGLLMLAVVEGEGDRLGLARGGAVAEPGAAAGAEQAGQGDGSRSCHPTGASRSERIGRGTPPFWQIARCSFTRFLREG